MKLCSFVLFCLIVPGISSAMTMTGSIGKNNESDLVSYALKVGNDQVTYSVNGSSSTDKGIYWSALDFSYIEAKRRISGETIKLENKGILEVYPRERISNGISLVGISISGKYLQGKFNDLIDISTLSVDGVQSRGRLNYGAFSGRYYAENDLHFGKYSIHSNESENIILNYDNAIGQNAMSISMIFGDLIVKGRINYTDATKAVISCDDDGCDTDNVVVATAGATNVNITKMDGSEPVLSQDPAIQTEDDRTIQALLAFLQLVNYDLSAE